MALGSHGFGGDPLGPMFSDSDGPAAPTRALSARNVALVLGCICLLAVALLSRGRQELLGGGELLELVEGCFEQGRASL